MIPPVALIDFISPDLNMFQNKNMFNMRPSILANLAATKDLAQDKNGQIPHINRMRTANCITSPTRSLELLRKSLQTAISRDIDAIIQNYLNVKYFQPAILNIKQNLGTDCITEDNLKQICRQILEDTKQIYSLSKTGTLMSRESSPFDYSDSDTSIMLTNDNLLQFKRDLKECDIENESKRVVKNNSSLVDFQNQNPFTKILKRDNAKWNSERISDQTYFIMGSKANKVLGFGQTRGRLYARHPELIRYVGDQEDKDWLLRNNLMPLTGGKAYLMLLDDIQELLESDDYRNNPNVQVSELKGFRVPPFLLAKIKSYIDSVRDDNNRILSSLLIGTSSLANFGQDTITYSNFSSNLMQSQSDIPIEKQQQNFLDTSVISNDCLLNFPDSDQQILQFFPQ